MVIKNPCHRLGNPIGHHFLSFNFRLDYYDTLGNIAILTGYLSLSKKDAIINGILFGYFLFLTYILIGYEGRTICE